MKYYVNYTQFYKKNVPKLNLPKTNTYKTPISSPREDPPS